MSRFPIVPRVGLRRILRVALRVALPALLVVPACGGPVADGGGRGAASASGRRSTARSSAEVAAALDHAQQAYFAGTWGVVVVEANKVLEGEATAEELYLAVKLIGLASCNRKDPRPVAFAWSRLLPVDRDGLRNQCAQQGLTITDEGQVVPR